MTVHEQQTLLRHCCMLQSLYCSILKLKFVGQIQFLEHEQIFKLLVDNEQKKGHSGLKRVNRDTFVKHRIVTEVYQYFGRQ